MSKKNKINIVYSTDSEFEYQYEQEYEPDTLTPEKQKLKIFYEKKNRKGKPVTMISGFVGTVEDLKILAKKLKNLCGAGGSVKNGEIIVQGDQRNKINNYLLSNGYKTRMM